MISPELCRAIVRNWMMQKGRLGRSKAKRLFRRVLQDDQRVELVPGLHMQLDLRRSTQDSIFWFYEEVEPALQWAIRTLLPVRGTFVDVGANVGLMGLLAIYERQARVLFVEPHPRLAQSIRTNILLNGFAENTEVLECAASDSTGEGELSFHGSNDGAHSLQELTGSWGSCRVRKDRLADILEKREISYVDLLKIDTEGHDWNVLRGLGEYLAPTYLGMIFVEMEHRDTFSEGIWHLLWGKGYRPFAPMTVYIDELRMLSRQEKQGKVVTLFRPMSAPQGLNMLWCERGSDVEKAMMDIHDVAVNK